HRKSYARARLALEANVVNHSHLAKEAIGPVGHSRRPVVALKLAKCPGGLVAAAEFGVKPLPVRIRLSPKGIRDPSDECGDVVPTELGKLGPQDEQLVIPGTEGLYPLDQEPHPIEGGLHTRGERR